jgi:hypothetical protein
LCESQQTDEDLSSARSPTTNRCQSKRQRLSLLYWVTSLCTQAVITRQLTVCTRRLIRAAWRSQRRVL